MSTGHVARRARANADGRRVRVVQVIARLNVGGPAALVLAVADGLDHERFSSTVLHGAVGAGEASWAEVRGATRGKGASLRPVRGLGPAVRPSDDAAALTALVKTLRRERPDIVHTHTAKAGALGRAAVRLLGPRGRRPKVVHTFHGHVLHGYFSPRVRRGVISVERQLARRTDAIVTVGATVRDDLLEAGIGRPEQYTVIPPGIDSLPIHERAAARQWVGATDGRPVVAFVGRLTGIKRPDRAIEAMRLLLARGVDAQLVIAGDGELRPEVEAAAQPLGDRIRLLGWTADVGRVLAAADVVLLTSDNEGMPVTLAEAAHAGIPAVATRVGSVPEVVLHGETGLVVDPTPAAVADALADLLGDPDRRASMGQAAIGHAATRFTTHTLVAAHQKLYDEVMGR